MAHQVHSSNWIMLLRFHTDLLKIKNVLQGHVGDKLRFVGFVGLSFLVKYVDFLLFEINQLRVSM